jgi:hypothetical protein
LSQLGISPGSLSPAFSPGMLGYTSTEDPAVTTVQLTAVANDTQASLSVDGKASPRKGNYQGALVMNKTSNVSTAITVTSADGKANMTYVIEFLSSGPAPAPPPPPPPPPAPAPAASSDATIKTLVVAPGTLQPAFQGSIVNYSVPEAANISSLQVTVTPNSTNATFTINGNKAVAGGAGTAVALQPGKNSSVVIVVTAADTKTTKTYTVIATESAPPAPPPPPPDATLKALSVSPGTVQPTFDPTVFIYNVPEAANLSSVDVTATPNSTNATVTIAGNKATAGNATSVPITPFANTSISIVVTAGDGKTTQTYTLTASEPPPPPPPPPADATLTALAVSVGQLSPNFTAGTHDYKVAEVAGTKSVTVTATTNSSTATVMIQGAPVKSGSPSADITLDATKATVVNITVTDGPGTYHKRYRTAHASHVQRMQVLTPESITYTVTVSVAEPAPPPPPPPADVDVTLKAVRVLPGTLTPAFEPKTLRRSFNVTEPGGVDDVKFTAITNSSGETMKLTDPEHPKGVVLISNVPQDVKLTKPDTVVTLDVTSKDTTKEDHYRFEIEKKKKPDVPPPQQTPAKVWQEFKTWEKGNSLIFYAIVVAAGGCLLFWFCSCVVRTGGAKKRKEAAYYGYDAFYAGGRGSSRGGRGSAGRGGDVSGESTVGALDPSSSFFPGDIPDRFGSGRTSRYKDRYDAIGDTRYSIR